MMMCLTCVILLLSIKQFQAVGNFRVDNSTIKAVVIPSGSSGSCATPEARQSIIESFQNEIKRRIAVAVTECGDGLWYRIAHIDMNDPKQQCPPAWREYTRGSVRACGRPVSESSSCPNISYITNRQYSKVCGRVIGYQVSSPDGMLLSQTIDNNYVDGVSITYGRNPRQHIWTYAAGVTENSTIQTPSNCPCLDSNERQPPGFVNDSYYCESGNPSDFFYSRAFLYGSDKLWDGRQCSYEGTCCTNNSPPWFNVALPNPTSDDIEVRICGDESTNNEDTPIELLDIYIQ